MNTITVPRLKLLTAMGIELEYMVVETDTLCVRPVTDQLIRLESGDYASEVERGPICWSNELTLHVLELKTNGPVATLGGVAEQFHHEVRRVNQLLTHLGARLMPTAMHPWMDPAKETRLWPHDNNPVYEAFNRIFDCRGHGWSNLQSCHLNFPFGNDEEFGRLHAALRVVLPLLPAIAASSPLQEGRLTGCLDTRLNVYRSNCSRVPSITGKVIPEQVFCSEQYHLEILERMYEDIAPLDPDGILQEEWLNARGAIARFDRSAIELRALDVQECPQADIAIAALVDAVVRKLVKEEWSPLSAQQSLSTDSLESIFLETMRHAEQALIGNRQFLQALGVSARVISAGDLWQQLQGSVLLPSGYEALRAPLKTILSKGPLARRILNAVGRAWDHSDLHRVYGELCACLAENRLFEP